MTTFDERERAAEGKFVHDEEIMFRAHARRDTKLGQWAASLMGMPAADAAGYAESLVSSGISSADESSVNTRVMQDLAKAGIVKSEAEINAKMGELLAVALAEIKASG